MKNERIYAFLFSIFNVLLYQILLSLYYPEVIFSKYWFIVIVTLIIINYYFFLKTIKNIHNLDKIKKEEHLYMDWLTSRRNDNLEVKHNHDNEGP